MRPLFDPIVSGDREHLAMIEVVVGPFPLEYASTVEAKYAGTFSVEGGQVSVIFPARGKTVTREMYGDAMTRLTKARPLEVCHRMNKKPKSDICVSCRLTYTTLCLRTCCVSS